jgi:hypothetical protein
MVFAPKEFRKDGRRKNREEVAMRKLWLAMVAAALVFTAAPSAARASWLSEFLHRQFDPAYYGYAYYAPAYRYYLPPNPATSWYGAYAPPVYGYYAPYRTFYWEGPRYYGHWHGDDHAWHEWHERQEHARHEWHEHHHH